MRYNNSPLLRYGLPAAVLGLGALFLIPGDDTALHASTVSEAPTRMAPSYLAASPELVAELEASLAPARTTENVAAREASLPEPGMPSEVEATPDPNLLAAARDALVAHQAAAETEEQEAAAAEAKTLRVGNSAVNMRVGPSTATGVIRALQPGEALEFSEMDGGWASVRTEDGESGWVYSSYLRGPGLATAETVRQAAPERESARQTAKVREPRRERRESAREDRHARVASDVYLRSGPSQNTERLFVLPAGERVQIAETRGSWARVVLRSGASGWVRIR